jgi:hypothetical protein
MTADAADRRALADPHLSAPDRGRAWRIGPAGQALQTDSGRLMTWPVTWLGGAPAAPWWPHTELSNGTALYPAGLAGGPGRTADDDAPGDSTRGPILPVHQELSWPKPVDTEHPFGAPWEPVGSPRSPRRRECALRSGRGPITLREQTHQFAGFPIVGEGPGASGLDTTSHPRDYVPVGGLGRPG